MINFKNMRITCILFLLICKISFGQIGLDIKLKKSDESIMVTIIDSSDYALFVEESAPSKFELSFENDTLSSYKFHYKVFGYVKVPTEPLREYASAELTISGKLFSLQLNYFNSYYGDKFYLINGELSKVSQDGYQSLIPFGTTVVKSKKELFIYNISKKGVRKKVFEW